jgi:hypothetical protein
LKSYKNIDGGIMTDIEEELEEVEKVIEGLNL